MLRALALLASAACVLVLIFRPAEPSHRPASDLYRRLATRTISRRAQQVVAEPTSYRDRLEHDYAPYELRRNLGFSTIYVVSLARRTDRRETMRKLAKASRMRKAC